jgi:hypothetical protein
VRASNLTRRLGAVARALSLTAIAVLASPASPASGGAATLTASVTPGELSYGAPATVAGRLAAFAPGVGAVPLALQANPYPFRGFATVARVTTAPDGTFAFAGLRPDRNTQLRVIVEGAPASTSPLLQLIVDPSVAISVRSLGPGQTRLRLRIRHAPEGAFASVSASWFLAPRGSRLFRLVAVTQTRELAHGVTYASATVDPPSKRFAYRVCLNPTWEPAMGPPATHGRCPQHDFLVPGHVS